MEPWRARGFWAPRFSGSFYDWEMDHVLIFLLKWQPERVNPFSKDRVVRMGPIMVICPIISLRMAFKCLWIGVFIRIQYLKCSGVS